MLDREKVVTVLKRRFPDASISEVAAAANALVGLDDEWEECTLFSPGPAAEAPFPCRESCYLSTCLRRGGAIRIFRRLE